MIKEHNNASFAAFESFVERSIFDIDAMIEPAMEGLFGTKSVEKLLAKVQKTVDKKCKKPEDCDDMIAEVAEMAEKYNTCLGGMKELAEQLKNEQIDKKEFKTKLAPYVKELKETCKMLKLSDVVKKTENVTDDEIANVKAFIIGTKEILDRKKTELEGHIASPSIESFINSLDEMMIAEEGAIANAKFALKKRFGDDKKAAKALIKEAKQYVKSGDYKTAITKYKEAKNAFKKILDAANKIPDRVYDESVAIGEKEVTGTRFSKATLKNWAKEQIANCEYAIDRIQTKMKKAMANESTIDIDSEIDALMTTVLESEIDALLADADTALEGKACEEEECADDEDEDDDDEDIDDILECSLK